MQDQDSENTGSTDSQKTQSIHSGSDMTVELGDWEVDNSTLVYPGLRVSNVFTNEQHFFEIGILPGVYVWYMTHPDWHVIEHEV